jgi:NADH dehydrogenase (ubiquinone) flavoprotein 2
LLDALRASVPHLPAQSPTQDDNFGKAPHVATHADARKGALTGKDDEVLSGDEVGKEKVKTVGKVTVPPPGPLSGRKTCENSKGQTSLLGELWGRPSRIRIDDNGIQNHSLCLQERSPVAYRCVAGIE